MIDIEFLKLALSKEIDAIKTYQDILIKCPNLTDLLSLLITEEQKHKMLIEKKITELTRD